MHVGRFVLLLATALTGACATPSTMASRQRLSEAVADLERNDFTAARAELVALASQCEAGYEGRRAMLLLAATELDPANPAASPREAARAAAAYLQLSDASQEERALARTIYRVAVDVGGESPVSANAADDASLLAPQFRRCESSIPTPVLDSLLATAGPSTADRIASLTGEVALQADSLAALRAQIRRINELLTTAPAAPRQRNHR
jgi:hypothetical protein